MATRFYKCRHCGNVIQKVVDSKVPVVCCGEKMEELVPGTTDAAQEKHVPVIDIDGNTVTVRVGDVEHPMEKEHYIEWIILETKEMEYKANLNPGEKPEATFILNDGDEVVAAYEYCNLHRLWKK